MIRVKKRGGIMNKKIWLIVSLVIIIGIAWSFTKNQKEVEKPSDEETKVEVSSGITSKDEEELQLDFFDQNMGFITQKYVLDDSHYLILNRSRDIDYPKEYPGDVLVWVEKRDGQIKTKQINDGDLKVMLELKDKNPFFVVGDKFYVVFHEGEGGVNEIRKSKGYVYRIDLKEGIKKSYETKGAFENFHIDENKKMIMVERISEDDRNSLPSYFSPYVLEHKRWENESWKTFKKVEVQPTLIDETSEKQ